MKRDSIYYQIFKRFPELIFELVDHRPEQTQNYRFEWVEVKETAFRIDGVFLPPEGATPRIIFFAEVQFQKDEALYHRFFTESMMYLNRNRSQYYDCFCVVIFPSRSLEPSDTRTHRMFLNSQKKSYFAIWFKHSSNSKEDTLAITALSHRLGVYT